MSRLLETYRRSYLGLSAQTWQMLAGVCLGVAWLLLIFWAASTLSIVGL